MEIQITFLGTSQAIPTITRNHTAILINYDSNNLLFDCGEGTQRQFRKAKINPCRLTHLFITHWHGDHILGIPGLFQTLALNNYSKTLQIYGPKGTKKYIKEIFNIFMPVKKIKIQIHEINSKKVLKTPDFEIQSTKLNHNCPCLGYSFIEKNKLRINKQKLNKILKKIKPKKQDLKKIQQLTKGKDIIINKQKLKSDQLTYEQKGKKITIILDTKITNNAINLAKNSDLLITESTYEDKEKELASKYKHLTCTQAAQIAKKANVKQLFLTHISQRYEFKEKKLLNQARKIFPKTRLAEDLTKVQI